MKAKNRKQSMRKGAFKKEENGNKSLKTWLWTGLEAVEKVASIVAAAYAFIRREEKMKMTRRFQVWFMAVLLVGLISGCGTVNNALVDKTKTVEYYRIFDIKTSAARKVVAQAASNGLGRNVGNAQEATPIPSSAELSDNPGRFKLVNPFEGSKFAALAGGGGSLGMKVATCDGAVWTANAQRKVMGSNNLNLTACLFQYKDGYHLDVYAVFTKKEGGIMQLSRSMANAALGTPEEWTEKTFLDIVRSIREKTGAEVAYLEGEPELSGTPWLDQGASIKQ